MPLVSILFLVYGLIFLSLHQHLRIKKRVQKRHISMRNLFPLHSFCSELATSSKEQNTIIK
jgi:hypothetical protein